MDKSFVVNGEVFSGVDVAVAEQEDKLNPPQTGYDVLSQPVLIVLRGRETPLDNRFNLFLKDTFDFILALSLSLMILSWLIPTMALLIKLDSRGPVFFLQRRNKKSGKVFNCIKFRTMHHGSDHKITRLGSFLRYHHIDELPQLLNVLGGDMSMIGPRPHMISENLKYGQLIERYDYRHRIKPGITGFAQSFGNFGAITDLKKVEERVEFDIEYISNWSLGMDLKIIYRTFCLMLKGLFVKHDR